MSELRRLLDIAEREGWTKELSHRIARVGGEPLVCVLCGWGWAGLNRCINPDCRGFCTWGDEKGGDPSSWEQHPDDEGSYPEGRWRPRPPP